MPARTQKTVGPVRPIAVVDIDGVVADVRHRLHHLERRPKNWTAFFAAAVNDPPHDEGLAIVERLAAEHEIVFLTGRPRHLERDTREWLRAHGLDGHTLLMRPEGDRRPAAVTKVERLRELAKRAPIAMVVDDDADVVHAVRRADFPVFHATWEQRDVVEETTLRSAQEAEGRT